MNNLQEFLTKLGACNEAKQWVANYNTLYDAWKACDRSEWLFWLAGRVGVEQKTIVRTAVAIARTALKHIPKHENRPRICLNVVEQWCNGTATVEQVHNAADVTYAAYAAYAARTARAAAYAAADAAAYDAARTAAYAAYAARTARAAAYAAAYAAYAAADAAAYAAARTAAYAAAADAAADAIRKHVMIQHSNIIRHNIPYSVLYAAAKANGLKEK